MKLGLEWSGESRVTAEASGTPQPLLIVGSYEFNEGATNDDVSRLWVVDPNTASEVATLGAASAPTYTSASGTSFPLVSSGVLFGLSDTDIGIKDSANNPKVSEIRSFFMREGGSGDPTSLAGVQRVIFDEVRTGTSYCSQHDLTLTFGLGDARQADRVTVRWPWRGTQDWRNLGARRLWRLVEGRDEAG